jgi:hypothetical protein
MSTKRPEHWRLTCRRSPTHSKTEIQSLAGYRELVNKIAEIPRYRCWLMCGAGHVTIRVQRRPDLGKRQPKRLDLGTEDLRHRQHRHVAPPPHLQRNANERVYIAQSAKGSKNNPHVAGSSLTDAHDDGVAAEPRRSHKPTHRSCEILPARGFFRALLNRSRLPYQSACNASNGLQRKFKVSGIDSAIVQANL